MTVAKLLQTISLLAKDSQVQLIELYQTIDLLYKKYGNKLTSKSNLDMLAKNFPDIVALLIQTQETIGLDAVHELCMSLAKLNNWVSVEVSAPSKHTGLESQIQKKFAGAAIHMHPSEQLGMKVQSSNWQQYARSIDKDIDKLIR